MLTAINSSSPSFIDTLLFKEMRWAFCAQIYITNISPTRIYNGILEDHQFCGSKIIPIRAKGASHIKITTTHDRKEP